MLTVRELLGGLGLTLLAGESHQDTPVRWVHISELADPTPWLSGGELLLTTGMALDSADRQRAFVTALADHGLAGLGIGTGFGHDVVPEALLDAARERDFPLFEVPYDTPFIAVTEQAFTRLVNEQYAMLQRSIAAQERLQRIVLSERGLDAVAGALASLVGGAALVFGGRGEPLARRTFRRELGEDAAEAIAAELRRRGRRPEPFAPTHPDVAGRALALPIVGAERSEASVPQAWLVGVKDLGGLSEYDRLILHQAVTVVALELLRGHVAHSTERRLAGDVLSEMLAGELEGAELSRRLEPFGLGGRVTALVVPHGERGGEVEGLLEDALRAEAVSALVAPHGALACAIVGGWASSDDELFDLAERVRRRVDPQIAAGVGRAVPIGEARRSFHEARCALEARAMGVGGVGGPNSDGPRLATYRDLGSFQLLLSLQDHEALALFCDSLLGPLEQGEGQYGDELVRSLEAFIEANGQWEAAARKLFCHRHTLRYRIRRIEEMTGRDLGSARDRIEFWLALRGREIAPPRLISGAA